MAEDTPDSLEYNTHSSRLVGATFFSGPPLERQPYLALSKLTVLIGPNGAGKSTILNDLSLNFRGADEDPRTIEGSRTPNADLTALFVRLDRSGLDAMLARRLERLVRGQTLADDFPDGLPLEGWSAEAASHDADGWMDVAPADAWIEVLRARAPQHASDDWRAIFDALKGSTTLALEPVHREGAVRAYWCLDEPLLEQPAELVGALDRCGLLEASAAGIEHHGDSDHLLVRGAPVIVAPVGLVTADILPVVVAVPQEVGRAPAELRHCIAELLYLARSSSDALLPPADPDRDGLAHNDTALWLHDEGDGSFSVDERAFGVVSVAETLVNRALPSFVADELRVSLGIQAVEYWRGGPELLVHLQPTSPVPERLSEEESGYPITSAAAGHELWIELAILEATRTLFAAARTLRQAEGEISVPALEQGEISVSAYADDIEGFVVEPRLYVIDEPERHLHPALARRAARWLERFARQPGTQVVIATHSPHFLGLTGDVLWSYVEPNAGLLDAEDESYFAVPSRIRPFSPHEVDAFGALAMTMGFDRGELLLDLSLFLFVEGETDKKVLEALFGAELRACRVALVPIQGAAGVETKGLTDAEILLRFTTTQPALLLDNLNRKDLNRLQNDAAFRRKAMRSRSAKDLELKAMARVIQRSLELDRRIESIAIPVKDIFDLLDEGILSRRFPRFPGHSAARKAASVAKDGPWKAFYGREYDIDLLAQPEVFAEVAKEMRDSGPLQDPRLGELLRSIRRAASGP